MTIHTGFKKGKRITIILKDGTKIIDKFVDSKSGCIFVEDHGKILLSKVRSTSIYRNDR